MTTVMPSRREQKRLNPRSDPHSPWLHIDPLVLLPGIGLSIIGIFVIYSATRGRDFENYITDFRDKQVIFSLVGAALMVLATVIDYRALYNWVWALYAGAVGLLVLVLVPGIGSTDPSGTVRSWFQFGGVGLQPSEPAKVAVILALAWWICRSEGQLSLVGVGVSLLIACTPMLLIYEQPDVGTMLVYAVIAFAMLLIGGADLRHLFLLSTAAVGVGYLSVPRLTAYQRTRLTAFIDPSVESNYNVEQAQIAIGNGGLAGAGFGKGIQTGSSSVPEQHTDFIFTVIGEELGFVGGVITIALFALLVLRLYRVTVIAGDLFGSLISAGVLAMFVFQIFQSIGMTMGIMPVTGIPLPFVSYGGSSALTSFIAVGLVGSVHMRRHHAAIEPAR